MLSVSVLKATAADNKVPEKIQTVLDAQVVAWNRGDVAGFMQGYQRTPDLIYIGNKLVTRGWQALFDSYRSRFKAPGGVEMGVLRLSEENLIMLGTDAADVWGQFDVTTSDGKRRGGLYTLVMRKLPEGWRTVYDRTSTEAL
jgi:beta-aspartyl-peptidase (threonine type)